MFFGKILFSHTASLHPGVQNGYQQLDLILVNAWGGGGGGGKMDSILFRTRGSKITLSCFIVIIMALDIFMVTGYI